MADERDPVEQFLELVLYAPLGLLIEARRRLPEFSRLGRTEVEQRVQLARFVGEFAVRRVGKTVVEQAGARLRPAPVPGPARSSAVPVGDQPAADVAPAASAPSVAPPASDRRDTPPPVIDLAIAGYDSLAASQIVRLLDGLTDDELSAVERYEAAHRGRRTILGKIEQVRAER